MARKRKQSRKKTKEWTGPLRKRRGGRETDETRADPPARAAADESGSTPPADAPIDAVEAIEVVEAVETSPSDRSVAADPGRERASAGEQTPAADARGVTGDFRREELEAASTALSREYLERMRQRMRGVAPDWTDRPEDPTSVALEVFAEQLAALDERIGDTEARLLRGSLDALEIWPVDPAPATGVVRLLPPRGLAAALRIPAGSRVTTAPGGGLPRVEFETADDVWLSPARLQRAFSVCSGELALLPGDAFGGGRPVALFEGEEVGRVLRLGDRRLTGLASGAGVTFRWPGVTAELTTARWEYLAVSGWRPVEPRCAIAAAGEASDVTRSLEISISGPLVDLRTDPSGLGWIRACLDGERELELTTPALEVDGAKTRGGDRPVARCQVDGGGLLADLTFSEGPVTVPPRASGRDVELAFGFDAPGPWSLFFDLLREEDDGDAESGVDSGAADDAVQVGGDRPAGAALVDVNPSPPCFVWEYSGPDGWSALDSGRLHDRTAGLQRCGSVHVEPPEDLTRRSYLGEACFWLRARRVGGGFALRQRLRSLRLGAVEVVQGVTRKAVPFGINLASYRGWLPLPELEAAQLERFERVVVEKDSAVEVWSRVEDLDSAPPDSRCFVLRRRDTGQLELSFDGAVSTRPVPEQGATLRIESVRAAAGAAGNVPPGSLTRLEPLGGALPGGADEDVVTVVQERATSGGRDLESSESRRRRALESLGGSPERAVTAEDYRRLAAAVLPEPARVDACPDPRWRGGILVTVLPCDATSEPRAPTLDALARYLEDRSVPGTHVRTIAATRLPAVLEVELRVPGELGLESATASRLEELTDWFRHVLRSELDPGAVAETPQPQVVVATDRLHDRSLRAILGTALRGQGERFGIPTDRVQVVSARLLGETGEATRRIESALASWRGGCYIDVQRIATVLGTG